MAASGGEVALSGGLALLQQSTCHRTFAPEIGSIGKIAENVYSYIHSIKFGSTIRRTFAHEKLNPR